MKTASDILMTEICNYQDQYEIYGFDSYFDNDELAKAKTLAEAERKVLELVESMCRQAMTDGTRITSESASFIQAYMVMAKLREEMGLQ